MHDSKKIVHILIDSPHIDTGCREFEIVAPGRHIFVVPGEVRVLQYVKKTKIIFLSYKDINSLIESNVCATVVFHSLNPSFLSILNSISPSTKIIWLGMGYDYYDLLLSEAYPNGLFLNETAALMQKRKKERIKQNFQKITLRKIKSYIIKMLENSVNVNPTVFTPTLLQKIDYFCPPTDIEYRMALELNKWFTAKFIPWNYGTAEDDLMIDEKRLGLHIGQNILVGNSATEENNHLEIFSIIKNKIDYSNRKIFVPLGYGNEWYSNYIVEQGFKFFGNAFVPMTEMIEKDNYIKILQSCGYAFMNHIRQQAGGNILTMMLHGSKIYMNENSPLYRWLLEKGAFIFSINAIQIETNIPNLLSPLTENPRRNNKMVVFNHIGRDAARLKTKYLVEQALLPFHFNE